MNKVPLRRTVRCPIFCQSHNLMIFATLQLALKINSPIHLLTGLSLSSRVFWSGCTWFWVSFVLVLFFFINLKHLIDGHFCFFPAHSSHFQVRRSGCPCTSLGLIVWCFLFELPKLGWILPWKSTILGNITSGESANLWRPDGRFSKARSIAGMGLLFYTLHIFSYPSAIVIVSISFFLNKNAIHLFFFWADLSWFCVLLQTRWKKNGQLTRQDTLVWAVERCNLHAVHIFPTDITFGYFHLRRQIPE